MKVELYLIGCHRYGLLAILIFENIINIPVLLQITIFGKYVACLYFIHTWLLICSYITQ